MPLTTLSSNGYGMRSALSEPQALQGFFKAHGGYSISRSPMEALDVLLDTGGGGAGAEPNVFAKLNGGLQHQQKGHGALGCTP